MTKDERLHWLGGFAKAKWMLFSTYATRNWIVREIDLFGFYREWKQNLAGKNPNIPMSAHQILEAEAWGRGARAACAINPPFPDEYTRGMPVPRE